MDVDIPALTITPLRPDDPAAVEAEYEIVRAATAVDVPDFPPPCRFHHEARLHHEWPGRRSLISLGYLDGVPVGALEVGLTVLDNLDNADVEITVHPAYRQRGVGRALFEHALGIVRAEGRKRVLGSGVETLPGGPERSTAPAEFARAMGASNALPEIRRRLDLTTVDTAEHDRLLAGAWPKAEGYSAVRWTGTAPDDVVDDIARLDSSFLDQAPLGDLALEPEKVDADRVRKSEAVREAQGTRAYSTGIRHDASGRLVALSALIMRRTIPYHAWQGITLVDPEHRGHRLGVISKIENVRFTVAAEPELRTIDTWNADVNSHMIAINEAMGFRPVDAWANWQRDV
jgi:GNAT superfamily N-acetyltransferase